MRYLNSSPRQWRPIERGEKRPGLLTEHGDIRSPDGPRLDQNSFLHMIQRLLTGGHAIRVQLTTLEVGEVQFSGGRRVRVGT